MAKLTNVQSSGKGRKLYHDECLFKIAITEKMDNGFEIKDLSANGCKAFQELINDTVYKGLTISVVDQLYRRKDDKSMNDEEDGKKIIHYGKDSKPFRLFGYYDKEGYFVITRIDPSHKTHNRK